MFKISENGFHKSVAVYGQNADSVDKMAVSEFALFMRLCAKKDYPTSPTLPNTEQSVVFIGADNEHAKAVGFNVPRERFSDDTVYICVKGKYAVLDGGKRGKLYAVYEFLERFLGVRFYAPDRYKTPTHENLAIEDQEIIFTPPIPYRRLYSYDVRWNKEYCARIRCNTASFPFELENYGNGQVWASPSCHSTFRRLLNPYDPEYGFDKHPEYFSFNKSKNARVASLTNPNGGWTWGEGEVCWTNPEVIELLTERIKEWILEQPTAEIFSITQNDWDGHCECPVCEKIAIKHGENGEPRYSAPIVYALNKIAKNIKEWQKTEERVKDRSIYLETFAYKYGTLPPVGMELEDNIVVRLCSHEACFYHKLRDENCVVNRQFVKAFEGWGKIAKQLYIWDYANNHCFHNAYNTLFPVIADNIRYYSKYKILGIFEEFQGYGRIGPWFFVRQYLYGKLLWNPQMDFETEYKEAFEFFYGNCAEEMMAVEKAFQENTDKIPDFHPRLSYTILPEHYSPEFLAKATSLFESAIEKANTGEAKLAVEKEYAYLKFIKMYLKRESLSLDEIQKTLDELAYYGIDFPKLKPFVAHYFEGKKNDLFLPEIEERNRRANVERIEALGN